MLKSILLGAALSAFTFCAALAQDMTGEYVMEGANPGGSGRYTGRVALALTGDTYQVAWIIGKARHVGTGIVTGDTLSVVYQQDANNLGIAVYKIGSDGTLTGRWTVLGGKKVGSETWRKEKGI